MSEKKVVSQIKLLKCPNQDGKQPLIFAQLIRTVSEAMTMPR
jgi:hypothetical protein